MNWKWKNFLAWQPMRTHLIKKKTSKSRKNDFRVLCVVDWKCVLVVLCVCLCLAVWLYTLYGLMWDDLSSNKGILLAINKLSSPSSWSHHCLPFINTTKNVWHSNWIYIHISGYSKGVYYFDLANIMKWIRLWNWWVRSEWTWLYSLIIVCLLNGTWQTFIWASIVLVIRKTIKCQQ